MTCGFKMVDVVCVKWGDEFSDDYVYNLKAMISRNTTTPFNFKVYTDKHLENIDYHPLEKNIKGWWNKLYLFSRHNTFQSNSIVYFDLDTVITGDINFLLNYNGDFMGIENLGVNNRFENNEIYKNVLQTGVMAWNPTKCYFIWEKFVEHRQYILSNYRGDGEYINDILKHQSSPIRPDFLQHKYPGRLKSYKYEIYENGLDKDTSIICFHGTPRPHEAISKTTYPWGVEFQPLPWIADYWKP